MLPPGAILARIKGPAEAIKRQLGELLPGRRVDAVQKDGDYVTFRIDTSSSKDQTISEALAHLVVKNGWSLAELTRERATLEHVFRKLTTDAAQEVSHA